MAKKAQKKPSNSYKKSVKARKGKYIKVVKALKGAKKQRIMSSLERATYLIDKWAAALESDKLHDNIKNWNEKTSLPPQRRVGENKLVEMLCVGCDIWKPLLPAYYIVGSGDTNLIVSDAGHESFKNCPSNPCNACYAVIQMKVRSTIYGYIYYIVAKYKRLGGVEWYAKQWEAQGGKISQIGDWSVVTPANCAILNMPMALTGRGMKDWFASSVDNTSPDHTLLCDHVPEHTRLICAELNIQQGEAIPNLLEAWREFLKLIVANVLLTLAANGRAKLAAQDAEMRENLENNMENKDSKVNNGVTASGSKNLREYNRQRSELDVATICSKAAYIHRLSDVRQKLYTESPLTAEQIYEKWIEQPRCAISGVLMTIENGPRRFSIDRIQSGVAHEKDTTRGICRLLNSPAGWTREKFCTMMLNQKLVDLPSVVRDEFQRELDKIRSKTFVGDGIAAVMLKIPFIKGILGMLQSWMT